MFSHQYHKYSIFKYPWIFMTIMNIHEFSWRLLLTIYNNFAGGLLEPFEFSAMQAYFPAAPPWDSWTPRVSRCRENIQDCIYHPASLLCHLFARQPDYINNKFHSSLHHLSTIFTNSNIWIIFYLLQLKRWTITMPWIYYSLKSSSS